ncbi:hypothetical protein KAFR_0D01820 [Kazachstania africana CBS 2517]|uniref:ER membrane protein complex subunit 6 n=1 Tax=Kazachstania africana (strain ATCC 22294 / BCRC 22015 / CBS 2517 / CECT 1963 / NBRC 1671 / NRRL Y-8276) TaxID=1071382 RepID=H2ATX9_KAZAF|nr:hypothetical protein KAFR_0D01820 [Kazachstania africana CBS 2517]CCF57829.1 hypothetical protein KAFR_0D01820 [Kazachstania africana CBS 2517]
MNNFEKQVKSQSNIIENKKRYVTLLDKIILINGIVSGILQLESMSGFLSFIAVYLISSFLFVAFICKFRVSKYLENSIGDLIFEHIVREFLGYVMAWTFSYALIN